MIVDESKYIIDVKKVGFIQNINIIFLGITLNIIKFLILFFSI